MAPKKNKKKDSFSIKELEKLTGIKAHTLRIWEQRYGVLVPDRTETNIRTYDENDLKMILNIALLNANGMRISKIAALSQEEISQHVLDVAESADQNDSLLNSLTLTMLELDEDKFEKVLSNVVIKLGFEKALIEVIYPFLERIGILWQTNTIVPAQEHFISNLIRHKLIVAADAQITSYKANAKRFVMFLPEGELHEVGLLFANFIVRSKGHRTVYLGQTVPISDLDVINEIYNPDAFFTVLTYQTGIEDVKPFLEQMHFKFPNKTILVAGSRIEESGVKNVWNNIEFVQDYQDMIRIVNSFG
ncbi:MAG: MerR family transcriptional regulator [Bacteroidetes bacterium]|nr:MerR family transcriptional regulator [Bacteroidota bacterium]